jgi:hypothetical protein
MLAIQTHPFHQRDVVRAVNLRLAGTRTITGRDILFIRRAYSVHLQDAHCNVQNYVSPRYTFSQQFIDWIITGLERDSRFLDRPVGRS